MYHMVIILLNINLSICIILSSCPRFQEPLSSLSGIPFTLDFRLRYISKQCTSLRDDWGTYALEYCPKGSDVLHDTGWQTKCLAFWWYCIAFLYWKSEECLCSRTFMTGVSRPLILPPLHSFGIISHTSSSSDSCHEQPHDSFQQQATDVISSYEKYGLLGCNCQSLSLCCWTEPVPIRVQPNSWAIFRTEPFNTLKSKISETVEWKLDGDMFCWSLEFGSCSTILPVCSSHPASINRPAFCQRPLGCVGYSLPHARRPICHGGSFIALQMAIRQ